VTAGQGHADYKVLNTCLGAIVDTWRLYMYLAREGKSYSVSASERHRAQDTWPLHTSPEQSQERPHIHTHTCTQRRARTHTHREREGEGEKEHVEEIQSCVRTHLRRCWTIRTTACMRIAAAVRRSALTFARKGLTTLHMLKHG
jgi:hypothetical protein